jgi:polar amino acid transport system substrate-binding protein
MHKLRILLVTIFLTALTGCSDHKDENTWIVGTSADNPPYEFMQDGKMVGFDIDLITAIAQHLGKDIELRNMDFHGLLAALSSNNLDIVIAGMSITPERQKRVEFSIPYADAKIAVLFRRDDKFKRPEDLYDKKSGAQLGTIWTLIAHDMSINYHFRTKALSSNLMLVEELKAKRIDAVILEESQAEKFTAKYPELSNFSVPQYGSSFAIALPKNTVLKKNIDHAIKQLKSKGTIDALAKKWGIVGEK